MRRRCHGQVGRDLGLHRHRRGIEVIEEGHRLDAPEESSRRNGQRGDGIEGQPGQKHQKIEGRGCTTLLGTWTAKV